MRSADFCIIAPSISSIRHLLRLHGGLQALDLLLLVLRTLVSVCSNMNPILSHNYQLTEGHRVDILFAPPPSSFLPFFSSLAGVASGVDWRRPLSNLRITFGLAYRYIDVQDTSLEGSVLWKKGDEPELGLE